MCLLPTDGGGNADMNDVLILVNKMRLIKKYAKEFPDDPPIYIYGHYLLDHNRQAYGVPIMLDDARSLGRGCSVLGNKFQMEYPSA